MTLLCLHTVLPCVLDQVLQDTQKQYRAQIEQQNETIKVLQDKNAVYEDQVKHFKSLCECVVDVSVCQCVTHQDS